MVDIPRVDILIVDEAQDMTALLYSFLCKLIRDISQAHGIVPRMMIIGDTHQCIFQFLGADHRYSY
jgi:superfamily I DNA/RNA helicase